MNLCLYGIISGEHPISFGPIGFGEGEVRGLPGNGLTAIFGPSPSTHFSGNTREELIRLLLAHQQTLERIMREVFVIPFKFGTVVASETEVRTLLAQSGSFLCSLIERMKGCAEFDVIATWEVKKILQEISEEDPEIATCKAEMAKKNQARRAVEGEAPSGLAGGGGDASPYYVGQLLAEALKRRAENWRKKIMERLGLAAEGKAEHDLLNDEMVLNTSFLIKKDYEKEFFRGVEELDLSFKGSLNFKCVGPLPPYSFATVTVKRFDPKEAQEAAKVLGLNGKAELAQVKKIYKELSRSAHPDTNPNIPMEHFERLNKAYELMADYCKEGARSLETGAIERYVRLETVAAGGS